MVVLERPCPSMLTTWLIIVLSAFSEMVFSNPLGLVESVHGIRDKEPSYLPEYNGFISLQTFNRTPLPSGNPRERYVSTNSDITTSDSILATSSASIAETAGTLEGNAEDHESTDLPHTSLSTEGEHLRARWSASSDADYTTGDDSQTTEPKIQVVTKTIADESTYHRSDDQQSLQEDEAAATSKIDELITSLEKNQTQFGETLESNGVDLPVETNGEVDIFDNLMATIHNHWLEFMKKMKMSVLDVWKSISKNMMERLEDFATTT